VPRTRPPYPEEFKREAIELVRLTGKSVREVATDLGIAEASLRGWIKQAERDEGKRPDGLSTDEREELRKLRRENRTLRMERETSPVRRVSRRSRVESPASAPLAAGAARPSRTTRGRPRTARRTVTTRSRRDPATSKRR
jgi:transposase